MQPVVGRLEPDLRRARVERLIASEWLERAGIVRRRQRIVGLSPVLVNGRLLGRAAECSG
jgi:hypothetical protein